ncbi:MAG: TIGR04282 family arsenosugar biosynthesis glycosyltransferase [Methylococcales bacterium]|nr:TIGR04282 family arsenosugar biosynthesis glycosyltransferase [Methylococcales bacterium]
MRYQYPDTVIQVFCKAPQTGQVKTRLITESISAEQAMQVHIELTERVLTLLHDTALCPVQLWCSPNTEFDFFQQLAAKYHLTLHQQSDCGLGGRLFDALNAGLQNFKQVLLIGCDCPSLITDDFKQAIIALKHGADVVLAPTEDGGYSLIGVKQPQTAVLSDVDMPWGTSQVLAITRERLKQQNLKGHEIRQQWDIDTPEDLARYRALSL